MKSSNRWVWVASAIFIAILVAATFVALFWPRIELAYHRHYFRKGSPEQQVEALVWICKHRLRKGMTREEVEGILGEELEKRFDNKWVEVTNLANGYGCEIWYRRRYIRLWFKEQKFLTYDILR